MQKVVREAIAEEKAQSYLRGETRSATCSRDGCVPCMYQSRSSTREFMSERMQEGCLESLTPLNASIKAYSL